MKEFDDLSVAMRKLAIAEAERDMFQAKCNEMKHDISTGVAGIKSVMKELDMDPNKLEDLNVMAMLSKLPFVLPTLSKKLSPLLPLIEKYGR
jgi:hypothetical protein